MLPVKLSSSFVVNESFVTTGEMLHVIVTDTKSVESSGQFDPDKVQEKIFSPGENPLTFVVADVESSKTPVPETTLQ